jgi:metal-responsive CopG/Arc/MetJ family transcriptional regulator
VSEPKQRGRPPGPRKVGKLVSMHLAQDVIERIDGLVAAEYAKSRTAAVERLAREGVQKHR